MNTPTVPTGKQERRLHHRWTPKSLLYVEMDGGNGGVVLNIGAGGLAVCTARPVLSNQVGDLHFKLLPSSEEITVPGQITWMGGSQRILGIRFVEAPESVPRRIREWVRTDTIHPSRVAGDRPKPAVGVGPILSSTPRPPEGSSGYWRPLDWEAGHRRASLTQPAPSAPAPVEVEEAASAVDSSRASGVVNALPRPADAAAPARAASTTSRPARQESRPALSLGSEIWREPPPVLPAYGEDLQERPLRKRPFILFFLLIVASTVLGVTSEGGILGAGKALWEMCAQAWEATVNPQPASETASNTEAPAVSTPSSPVPASAPPSSESSEPRANPKQPAAKAIEPRASRRPAARDRASTRALAGAENRETHTSPTHLNVVPLHSASARGTVFVQSHFLAVRVPPEMRSPMALRRAGLRWGDRLSETPPAYPSEALRRGVEGTVNLHAVIGRDGRVASVRVKDGPELLANAAQSAVQGWRYEPSLLGRAAVEWEEAITVEFRLPKNMPGR